MKIMIEDNTIHIIIVLYKTSLENSKTYTSLIKHIHLFKHEYSLIIYNNSCEISIPNSEHYTLINASENQKLTGAYNFALDFAKTNQAKWLLLLDQDTEITSDYFSKLSACLSGDSITNDIVAIVPFLTENKKQISPHNIFFFSNLVGLVKKPGVQHRHIIALNTLSLIRTDFISKIGGFSTKYPLDMLDYWTYTQIHKHKMKIYVLNTHVEHCLSVSDFEKNMSVSRYADLIEAEKSLMRESGALQLLVYKIKLIFRFLKQFIRFKNKRFSQITFNHIFR